MFQRQMALTTAHVDNKPHLSVPALCLGNFFQKLYAMAQV